MSHTNSLVPMRQVGGARQQFLQEPGLPFATHLPAAEIHSCCRGLGHGFRQRIFTPAVTLWTFLSQVLDPDHSCRQAVARLNAYRVGRGLRPSAPDTGGYCKARGRLPEELLADLTRTTARHLQDRVATPWLWKGRRVKVADGTGVSMPDTPANQKAYPKSKKLPPGVGFPMLRLVVVFNLAVGTVLDAALGKFQGKGHGEISLFRRLTGILERGDVLLADRLYATFWEMAQVLAVGADAVMRLHAGRAAVWFRGRGHSTANRRIWWQKPPRPDWLSRAEYAKIPQWLCLRALRVDVRQRGFRTRRLVLVTTLTEAQTVSHADLADLYRRRWQAEVCQPEYPSSAHLYQFAA